MSVSSRGAAEPELTTQFESPVDPYLHPRCRPSTIDNWLVRMSIVTAMRRELPRFHGLVLDVGCGEMPYRRLLLKSPSRVDRYLGLDLTEEGYGRASPHLVWDGVRIPLTDSSVDCALLTEVLEHCPHPERVLGEIARVLRPGGLLFLTVPFLWPLHDVPHDEYRYTPFALERLLECAGFDSVQMQAMGGWDRALAQMIGLWTRRRPMPPVLRSLFSLLAWPIVLLLATLDSTPKDLGVRDGMITGLVATSVRTRESQQVSANPCPQSVTEFDKVETR